MRTLCSLSFVYRPHLRLSLPVPEDIIAKYSYVFSKPKHAPLCILKYLNSFAVLSKEAYVALDEVEGRIGNESKIIQGLVQHISTNHLPPEIYFNCATILCPVH